MVLYSVQGGKGEEKGTYVEEEFLRFAILVGLFEVDVSDRVDDEDLAVLCDHTLAGTGGAIGRRRSGGCPRGLDALGLLLGFILLGVLLLHASLAPIHGLHGIGILAYRRRRRSRRPCGRGIQAGDVEVVAPRGAAGILDVPVDEGLLLLPVHAEEEQMPAAADRNEESQQHGEETRSEAGVVVAGALPLGEAVAQEVIVPLSARSAQDVGHDAEARESIAGSFGGGLDLCLGRALGDMDARLLALGLLLPFARRLVGDELVLDLVGVDKAGSLLIALIDLILAGRGGDAQEVVEGYPGPL